MTPSSSPSTDTSTPTRPQNDGGTDPAALMSRPEAASAEDDRSTSEIQALFQAQRQHQPHVRASTVDARRAKLQRLRSAVYSRRHEIQDAMHADFCKPPEEVDLTEIKAVMEEADFASEHLDAWLAPESAKSPPLLTGTSSEIRYEPRGVCLIISPWNYPFNLTLRPLVSAIAAGNSVIVKPSEYTPHSSRVMRDMMAEIFDPREVTVVEGAVDTAQALLDLPFDHFYFTGSPEVGKIVMRAAADHLSSVTLELGGKSPTIVDASADVDDAAAKTAWGKFTNAGQTCIAPDHVYVHESIQDAFLDRLAHHVRAFYGDTEAERRASPDYCRIVNDRHFQRLREMLDDALDYGARIVIGGDTVESDEYLSPTVLSNVSNDSRVMTEEIFGPILPVLPFRSIDTVVRDIASRPHPLALYLFTRRDDVEKDVLDRTHSGGACINEVLLHNLNLHIPFGGAGHSGIGMGNGKYAVREFQHARSVLRRSYGSRLMRKMYPPYGSMSRRLIDLLVKYF